MPSFINRVQGREVVFKILEGWVQIAKSLLSIENILPGLIEENTNSGHGRHRDWNHLSSMAHFPSYTPFLQNA
jgi:hypothetical protein